MKAFPQQHSIKLRALPEIYSWPVETLAFPARYTRGGSLLVCADARKPEPTTQVERNLLATSLRISKSLFARNLTRHVAVSTYARGESKGRA